MDFLNNKLYLEDIRAIAELPLPWGKFAGKNILIVGATGMIGSFLVDVLMWKNTTECLECAIYAMSRSFEKAKKRFERYWTHDNFQFVQGDVNEEICIDEKKIDYLFHAASNTHPIAYVMEPVNTIITNIIGTFRLLQFAKKVHVERFVFLSSVEVYGENRGDCDRFKEEYCGYINCNTLRAGYPESKRAGEALCQAYIRQEGLDIVIPRLSRTYGPTMQMTDSKALSQFIKNGLAKEDIVLKSEGKQFYSYSYVADAVSGILYCLFYGVCGEAYNIADRDSDTTLKKLADLIAENVGKKVVFELPDIEEQAGYSKATKALMDSSQLCDLGWRAQYNITQGIRRTLQILKERE